VALPEAYAPASIAVRVSGERKFPLHHKAIVLEEEFYNIFYNNPPMDLLKYKDSSTNDFVIFHLGEESETGI
jgi:hypothetical protein